MYEGLVCILLTVSPSLLASPGELVSMGNAQSVMSATYTVSVSPSHPVTTPGRNFTFICIVSNTLQNVTWIVNGSTLESLGLDYAIAQPMNGIGTLRFLNLGLEDNHTTVQCGGLLQSGATCLSMEVILLLQGSVKQSGCM